MSPNWHIQPVSFNTNQPFTVEYSDTLLEELQSTTVASTQARQRNVETIRQFVSSPTAEKALKSAHMDSRQVKDAVSRLSDQELSQLAARASKAQADFAAGTLSNRDLIIILVCIAALILIIVAVR